MISEQLSELIRPVILVQKIIWFIIAFSILFYLVLLYFLLGGTMDSELSAGLGFEVLIYILTGASAAGSIYYYRYSTSDIKLRNFMARELDIEQLAKDPRTSEIDHEKLDKLNSVPKEEAKIYSLMFDFQKNITISLLLSELVVIFGSTLSFLTGNFSRIVPFAIVSVILCIWMFPKPQSLIKRTQNYKVPMED
jgi:hypothetical protein